VVRLAVDRRWPLLVLTGLALVVSVAFNLVYTIGDIYVLYTPAYLILVLWLMVGAGTLSQVLARGWSLVVGAGPGRQPRRGSVWRRMRTIVSVLAVIPCFALPVWMVATRYADLDQSGNTRDRECWEEILSEPLQPEAVLISNDRDDIMPMWYLQNVGDGQRLRPDLLGLFPLITTEYPTLAHVLDLALSTDRPVYLIKEMPGIEVRIDVEQERHLWRVLGPAAGEEPNVLCDLSLAGVITLSGYELSPYSPHPGQELQVSLHWEAQQPIGAVYHSFIHLLDSSGQKVVQSDRQPGGVYYPTTLWQPGESLRDDHTLNLPHGTPPGVYRMLVGMYRLSSEGTLELLGEPSVVGRVEITADG